MPSLGRLVAVGISGAGRRTVDRRLALAPGAPHVDLDALVWWPGWKPRLPADSRRDVQEVAA